MSKEQEEARTVVMDNKKMEMLEGVLNILDPDRVSDERMYAFHAAAELYGMWEKERAIK